MFIFSNKRRFNNDILLNNKCIEEIRMILNFYQIYYPIWNVNFVFKLDDPIGFI